MTDQEIKDLIEQLRKDKEEFEAKNNSLKEEIENLKLEKDKDILIAKINAIDCEFKCDEQCNLDYLKGYLNASDIYKKKIDLINTELVKTNSLSIPLSGIVPPSAPAHKYINTPIGKKLESEVPDSMRARYSIQTKPQEVK